MAEETTNYGLIKPGESDYYDVDISNGNMDIIDRVMKENTNAISEVGASLEQTESTVQTIAASVEALEDEVAALTESTDAHAADTTVHVTAAERASWNNKANAGHTHGAAQITGGSFDGAVQAKQSGQNANVSLLRNSMLVSVETTPTVNGEIYWMYE